jgi:acyl-CoA synthetase (AMP-forming)/AMP-acid ligase II
MTEPEWNFGDIFEAIAASIPAVPAVVDGEREFSWHEFDARTAGLATQAKVAVYLRNCAEFLESYTGALLARLVPVNVNYRYGAEELVYLLTDSDTEAVIVHAEFADSVAVIAPQLPGVRRWYVVGGIPDSLRELAATGAVLDYEQRVQARVGERPAVGARSGSDLLLIYPGGTTGMPKGVMWRQTDLFGALVPTSRAAFGIPSLETVADFVAAIPQPGPRGLTASPMMHGTGLLHQFVMLVSGGTAIVYNNRRFDPDQLWGTVQDKRVSAMVIVGDAFGMPLLDALAPGRYDLSELKVISSSGAIWSSANKLGLLEQLPWLTLWDALAAGEGFGVAVSMMTAAAPPEETGQFVLGGHIRVQSEDGSFLEPGQAGTGAVVVTGPLPLGYYKDPVKTASSFLTTPEGVRYSVPGDFVEVLANGRIQFLGRGSGCINTGGEKVFVEEVEEVLHNHPSVADAACVGVPDERFGAVVCAIVRLRPGATLTQEELATHVKARLAGYKAPRRLVLVDDVPRTAQGKPEYAALKELAISRLTRA